MGLFKFRFGGEGFLGKSVATLFLVVLFSAIFLPVSSRYQSDLLFNLLFQLGSLVFKLGLIPLTLATVFAFVGFNRSLKHGVLSYFLVILSLNFLWATFVEDHFFSFLPRYSGRFTFLLISIGILVCGMVISLGKDDFIFLTTRFGLFVLEGFKGIRDFSYSFLKSQYNFLLGLFKRNKVEYLSPSIFVKELKAKSRVTESPTLKVAKNVEHLPQMSSQDAGRQQDTIETDNFAKNVISFSSTRARRTSTYRRPSLGLFVAEDNSSYVDKRELDDLSNRIRESLSEFNVSGKIKEVHPGPVVTTFEFEPAPGIKVGKIATLQDDLAMSLKAHSIRIVAPIPKKGTVGIEVPNKSRKMVRLRSVLESKVFAAAGDLALCLGKDTTGEPVVVDLASMPHLLIAGATGTGKSVCINSLLISLLYKNSQDNLGLILIDPKVLELSVYDSLPHLKAPVITEPKKAKVVLQWAVKEMERRYKYLQKFGVRNIDSFNALEDASEKLSKLVIIIDELADLMFTVGKEIEELIIRLAQKARAAGIYLIMATQRPSVDVVTGLIKANFPARISFRVVSRVDSRTILDQMGAEKLLGKGDMLVMLPGAVGLKRVHGAFVSDAEVQKFVEEVKRNGEPVYEQEILELLEATEKQENQVQIEVDEDSDDELYKKALEIIVQKGQASTSMIQRALRIGYNRAARIVEKMEQEGFLGTSDGVRPREVLYQNIKRVYPNL